jgi:hypothetical protein
MTVLKLLLLILTLITINAQNGKLRNLIPECRYINDNYIEWQNLNQTNGVQFKVSSCGLNSGWSGVALGPDQVIFNFFNFSLRVFPTQPL